MEERFSCVFHWLLELRTVWDGHTASLSANYCFWVHDLAKKPALLVPNVISHENFILLCFMDRFSNKILFLAESTIC